MLNILVDFILYIVFDFELQTFFCMKINFVVYEYILYFINYLVLYS